LDPYSYLTQSDSGFAVRHSLSVDPITPLDSVPEEGEHELYSRVVSQKYGTFLDTSLFIIDKTPPVVHIDSVTPGQIFNSSTVMHYSISDAHLDTVKTEKTLNGIAYTGQTISINGSYAFRIKAMDLAGNVTDTSVSFALAPHLRVIGAPHTLTLHEDVSDSSYDVAATFTPGSGLTYAVFPAANLGLGITTSKHLYVQPGSNFSGIRDVVLKGTLSGVDVLDTLRITVLPVNDLPVLVSSDSILGNGGEPVSYHVLISDADDVPTFHVSGLPAWLSQSGDLLSGTPPFMGGDTTFTLAVSDGDTTINHTIYVHILDMNTAPVILSRIEFEPAAAAQNIDVDLSPYPSDAEQDASTLVWSWGTSSHFTVDAGANKDLFTIVPTSGFHDTVTVRLTLTDPDGAYTYQDVLLDWTLDNGPVHTFLKHWYPMREGTGTVVNDSLTTAAFTLTSSSMWNAADTGISFRTVTTASSDSSTTLNPARGLSFEFWFKTDSLVSSRINLVTFGRPSAPTYPAWAFRLQNHDLKVYQSDGSDTSEASFANAVVHENEWHHFVASIEQDSVALYRNGVLFGKVGNPALNTSPVAVTPALGGADSVGKNPAGIAMLRVYERTFSAFKANHNFKKTEKQEGLAFFLEAEHYASRVGSYFPFLTLASLASDTALGTDDSTTEECILNPSDSSYVDYTVSITQSGVYYLFARDLGKVYDNSFWVQVDATTPKSWHTSFGNAWRTDWDKDPTSSDPHQWTLSVGTHHIRIYTREKGTFLDWLGLSTRDDLVLPFVANPAHF
jgi:hypothetical protein